MLVTLLQAETIATAQSTPQTQRNNLSEKIDTANLDLKTFAEQVVGNNTGNYEKAKKLLEWLSNSLEWKATDYKQRTVKEILARGGGNCFELAKLYITMIKELNIQHRRLPRSIFTATARQDNKRLKRKSGSPAVQCLYSEDSTTITVG